MATAEVFEGWAVVDLFGHIQVAGYITEVSLFGVKMARIDVPEVPARKSSWPGDPPLLAIPQHTRHYNGAAIYGMVGTTEEVARAAAVRLRTEPPRPLVPSSRQLAGPDSQDAVFEEDRARGECDGCDAPAVHFGDDGTPLCVDCYDSVAVEATEDAEGHDDSQKGKADGGGAAAAAGDSSETSGDGVPAPPPEAAV